VGEADEHEHVAPILSCFTHELVEPFPISSGSEEYGCLHPLKALPVVLKEGQVKRFEFS